ncbi:MAG: PD40 domain-containing protein [Myxococcales bacterium]|nr:PD40 domain-containing protein [Myxococcales bacterium]
MPQCLARRLLRRFSFPRSSLPRWRASLWALGLVVVWLVLGGTPREAAAANDPDLDYWTIETAHFRIHYAKNLEEVAEHVARQSEAIHERLIEPLGYSPDEKTEVALTDVTDSANGSATGLPYNTVRLFVTAPDDLSSLGDYDDWMLGLMTHEYTHILHIDNLSGIPAIVNAVLGKTFVPNQVQPRWLIEGLAVVAESAFSSGGRIRSSLFDMQLRADFIEDNVATLAQISSDARRWPQGTLWYLYGSRFLQWIVDIYGLDVLRAVSTDYGASAIPWGINRAIRRQTGRTYVELYEGFQKSMKRRYGRQMKAVRRRGLREGKRLTYHGFSLEYPQFIPERARDGGGPYQLHYTRSDGHARKGVYRIDLADAEDGELIDETLVARSNGDSPVSYTPEGDLVFASVVPYKRIYRRHDLFQLEKGKTAPWGLEGYRERLTVGLRALAPSISPDGRHAVFTRNDAGTTRLKIADRSAEGKLSGIHDLVPVQAYDQIYTPQYSPDGQKVVYSAWRRGGFRDLEIADLRTGETRKLTLDRALDTNPTWSADGSRIYFASDRTGIFNIYELTLEGGRLRQVTNVRTGAMMPTVSEDGKLLAYVGYTSKGFDLYVMKLDESRFLEPEAPRSDRPDPLGAPPPVKMQKYRYTPWRTLRPRTFTFSLQPGNFSSNQVTLSLATTDILGLHAFGTSLIVDPGAPGPMVSADYAYLRLPVDMSLSLSNRYTPRSDFRINDENPEYVERSYSIRSALSYTHPGEFISQSIGMSYTAAITEIAEPVVPTTPRDPYAGVTVRPNEGLISSIRASYSINAVEGSYWTPGPVRGWALSLGLDAADKFTASEESFYAATYTANGYLEMPWGWHHTLAVRSSGGMSTGTFARRTIFFVGGYNLEDVTFPDALFSTAFNGAFVLRGYAPGTYRGRAYLLNNVEYRIPVANPDFGIQTLPAYLRRVDLNFFMDWGGAWNRLDYDAFELFSQKAILHHPDLHTGVGLELWLGITLGYGLPIQMRLGHAVGMSHAAIPGGQTYFIASSAY